MALDSLTSTGVANIGGMLRPGLAPNKAPHIDLDSTRYPESTFLVRDGDDLFGQGGVGARRKMLSVGSKIQEQTAAEVLERNSPPIITHASR